MFSTLLGLTPASGATAADEGGAEGIGLGRDMGSGPGMDEAVPTEMAPTGDGCEMSTGGCGAGAGCDGCCCEEGSAGWSRMGSHPEALMFAPFTEGGRTPSSDTPNESASFARTGSGSTTSSSGSGSGRGSATTGRGSTSSIMTASSGSGSTMASSGDTGGRGAGGAVEGVGGGMGFFAT